MMKTKFLLTLLAIFMCFTLVFSPCVFADEYDLYDDDDFEEELKRQQYFDKDALCILYELFDGDLDMQ